MVTSQKDGGWGVCGGLCPPQTPHLTLFIEMIQVGHWKISVYPTWDQTGVQPPPKTPIAPLAMKPFPGNN